MVFSQAAVQIKYEKRQNIVTNLVALFSTKVSTLLYLYCLETLSKAFDFHPHVVAQVKMSQDDGIW